MLLNYWYVGGTSRELKTTPLERIVCKLPIVFFRPADGSICALQNFCSHRRAPLSDGRVIGDDIECPYHGMRFTGSGKCIFIPSQEDIPGRADVRSFPVREKHGFIWVWPGDPELADPATIPNLPWRDDPQWNSETIYFYNVKGSHILMTDNLLDLGHVAFIHADTIGFDPADLKNDPLQTTTEGDKVINTRVLKNVRPGVVVAKWGNFAGNIDRTSISTWSPPCFTSIYFANGDRNTKLEMQIDHLITPETDKTHNYWVSVSRNFKIDDEDVSRLMHDDNDRVHQQDLKIVEAQQQMIDLVPDYQDMPIRQDKGLIIAHRTLSRLEKEEREGRGAAAGMV